MSRVQTFEQRILNNAEKLILKHTSNYEERVLFLERVAAFYSKASIDKYWDMFCIDTHGFEISNSIIIQFIDLIEQTDISIPFAISSLIREPISIEDQKKNGAFYTDYRLSRFLAKQRKQNIKKDSSVVDFASGTGILLIGIAEQYYKKYRKNFNSWLENKLYAFDLSENALRGVQASFLAMTNSIESLLKMVSKWKVCDSLLDNDLDKLTFDIVVGNPPWGKIKLTRHSFSLREGNQRIYGSQYTAFDEEKYAEEKNDVSQYAAVIKAKYTLLNNAEPDMYMAFIQRALMATKSSKGIVSLLVPAGLIRSQGTQAIREFLIENSEKMQLYLFDNKANFFSIDSRFKFLLFSIDCRNKKLKDMDFNICGVENNEIALGESVSFNVASLKKIRPDLTIPEVRNEREKEIFFKVYRNGRKWGTTDDCWLADISREIDMTSDKKKFVSHSGIGLLPVVEGRMIQQFRFGVKSYVSGSGRSAVWEPCSHGGNAQFYIHRNNLSTSQLKRTRSIRVGYCDIAGQTNERAMMSAVIPENYICGNKVPTILFPNGDSDLVYLWIGISNSFVFDWMIRRVISTTINYFLLFSVPIPNIEIQSDLAQRIVLNSKELSGMKKGYYHDRRMQELRSEIDALVAKAYGLDIDDLKIILGDFPLLDRKQTSILNEVKSYITRDLVLSKVEKIFELDEKEYSRRSLLYKKGDKAYIPNEMNCLCNKR